MKEADEKWTPNPISIADTIPNGLAKNNLILRDCVAVGCIDEDFNCIMYTFDVASVPDFS